MYSVLSMIFLFLFLAPLAGLASPGELGRAGWEAEELRRIHGERLVDCVMHVSSGMLLIDARSDEESIARVRAIRLEARMELESGRVAGAAADILRGRLARVMELDFVRSTESEAELCRAEAFVRGRAPVSAGLCDREKSPGARLASNAPGALSPGSGSPARRTDSRHASSTHPPRVCATNINSREFRFDGAKVDYWRLFLYRWEDLPWFREACISFPPFARAFARACVSIIPEILKKPFNHRAAQIPEIIMDEAFFCPKGRRRSPRTRFPSTAINRSDMPSLHRAPLSPTIREVPV